MHLENLLGLRQRWKDLGAHVLPHVFPPATGKRQRAHLLGSTYDEWGLLYSPDTDASRPSPDLIDLALRASSRARNVDLSSVAQRGTRDEERNAPVTWPGEHYRMLVALAEEWRNGDPVAVVEVGTFAGASALSLVASRTVERVTTFDLVPWHSIPFSVLRPHDFGPRLEQRLGDLGDPEVFAFNADVLASADIVFVDAAKDGVFEYRFLPQLLALRPARQQLLVLDDVHVLPMLNLWRELPLPKLDIASFGHWSGTGLIDRRQVVLDWTPPSAALGRQFGPLLRRWRGQSISSATVRGRLA